MKVMIPMDEDRQNVCVSFGRAPFFMLHDIDTNETIFLKNPAADAAGGAGTKSAQFVVDHGADAIITVRCGENAAEVCNAAEIAIYKANGTDANANLAAWKENKLEKLTHFHAGFHGIQ